MFSNTGISGNNMFSDSMIQKLEICEIT